MSYIYKITNNVTGMSYVGNTSYDIQKRWKEHWHDSRKERCSKRPLYKDMRRYGIDNFSIGIIEECKPDVAAAREIYWIKKLNTFNHGYNCTIGGKGKSFVDYTTLSKIYSETRSISQTAQMLGVSIDTVSNFLHETNTNLPSRHETSIIHEMAKPVEVIDSNEGIIQEFDSIYSAARWMMKSNSRLKSETSVCNNITRVCKNKGRTAYGYIWRFSKHNNVV